MNTAFRCGWRSIWGLIPLVLMACGCAPVDQAEPGTDLAIHLSGPDCLPNPPYPCVEPGEVGLDEELLRAFIDDVADWVEDDRLMGAELLIIKDRMIAWHAAVGWSDRERELPLERNSIYRIRSMTKPFVGATVLMLAEEGRLDLDDRVADYLPSFDNERSGSITIRQLLSHGAGFEQTGFPAAYWTSPNLREAIKVVGEEGPPNAPGQRYRYADRNSATLGALVAELTGAPVEEAIRSRILGPLGLMDTYTHFSPDSSWASRMNSTYSMQGRTLTRYWDNAQPQQAPWFRASGGIYTTVFDYARWLEVWMDGGGLEGGRLLTSASVDEALTSGYSDRYGLHWEIFSDRREGELPIFGHGGSDGTFAVAFPDADVMILYFTQSRGAMSAWRDAIRRLPGLVGLEAKLR